MIDAGWIKWKPQEGQPSVTENPLPNHDGKGSATVNALDGLSSQDTRPRVCDVRIPMKMIFESLIFAGYITTVPPYSDARPYNLD